MSESLRPGLSVAPARLLLRARVVLPVVRPPIDDGGVLLVGTKVAAVDTWRNLQSQSNDQALDLGDVILMPGLINAHCHLDYTEMAGLIAPTKSFPDWIKGILALKAHQSYSDYAAAWLRGAKMLLQHGTTTVADIEAVPELLPEVLSATPLRVCSMMEMTGVRSRRTPAAILRGALDQAEGLATDRSFAGLSPHAPYSTTPELLRLTAATARLKNWLVAIHVAESSEEFDMYAFGQGPMFEWLRAQRDMSDAGAGSPVRYLEKQGLLGPNLLAIHVNYLGEGDADLLGRSGVNVVHCPRSHAYFGHTPFPRGPLQAAGVNVCLGTDSLASVRRTSRAKLELDLLAEMRSMADRDPALSPEDLVRLATLNGARALGRSGRLGELSPGAMADLIVLPASKQARKSYDAVLRHTGPVAGAMIHGQWALRPPRL